MGKIYKIHVHGVKGGKKTIDVANSDEEFNNTVISAFKEKLVERFPELKGMQFKIAFLGVVLDDSDTFCQGKIHDGSSIFIIQRLLGGGFAV